MLAHLLTLGALALSGPPCFTPIVMAESSTPVVNRYLSEGSAWPGSLTTVEQHMTDDVVTLAPTTTLKEAAILMDEKRITGAPVVTGDGALLGVLSRSDLFRVIATGTAGGDGSSSSDDASDETEGAVDAVSMLNELEATLITEVMTADPMTIQPSATVLEAAQLMYPKRINRLMVVEEAEGDGAPPRLVGVITTTDVVRMAFCDELSEVDYGEDDE